MLVARRHRPMVKARLAGFVALGVCLLAPVAAASKSPGPPIARMDAVTASGGSPESPHGRVANVAISAQSGPSGESPSGAVSFTLFFSQFGSVAVTQRVTCLRVSGNTAVVNSTDSFGGTVTTQLVDNGGNGKDTMSVDATGQPPGNCRPYVGGPIWTLTNGRARVVDAAPLPTSKEQCKNGGFAQFGFANQGQCIKFVNHD